MCGQPAHRLGVQVLRPPSQPCQSHVLDHPRTQWRHGGSPFAYVPTAPPQARRFKGYTPLTTTPGRPTVTLGEAVPSNFDMTDTIKDRELVTKGDLSWLILPAVLS